MNAYQIKRVAGLGLVIFACAFFISTSALTARADVTTPPADPSTSLGTSTTVTTDTSAPADTTPTDTAVTTDTTSTDTSSNTSAPADSSVSTDTSASTDTTGTTTGTTTPTVTTDTTTTTSLDTSTTTPAPSPLITNVPTLTTDQADYTPGSVVNVFGHFFASLGNYVLHLVGTNPDGSQTQEATQSVTANDTGDLNASFTLENIFRPFYNLFATDSNGTQVAATSFSDNINYDKSGYDKGAAVWGTGNQSGYSENDWVQYQYTINGLTSGSVPDFNVVYDEQVGGRIFIDALSNFRVILDAPVAGSSNSRLADGTPEPPTSTATWKTFTPTNINKAYTSGTCGVAEAVNTPAASHCFHVTGSVLASAVSMPGTGTHTITIFFEAHMAPTYIWKTGHEDQSVNCPSIYCIAAPANAVPLTVQGVDTYNGWNTTAFTGAGGGGSNKHFNLQDQSAGPQGAITLPIPAVTLPTGSITIVKVTNPSPAVGVSFTFTSDFGPFNLDTDPGTATATSTTFSNLPAGTYNFAEGSEPNGWAFGSLVCSPTQAGINGQSVPIVIPAAGGAVTCTYTNHINQVAPTVTTAIHDASHTVITTAPAGSTVHDSVSVTGSNGTPTGTVTFGWFTNNSCSGATTTTSTAVPLVSGSADATGFPQGPLTVGSYSFKAFYSGDANYFPGAAACEPLSVTKVTPTLGTTPNPASGNVGAVLNDSATLTGAINPTGSITFNLYPPSDASCSLTPAYTQAVPLSGNSAVTSPGFTSNVSGTWHWTANYPGDTNNNSASSGCSAEPVTVSKINSNTSTVIHDTNHATVTSVALGSTVHDQATVTGSGPTPTGNVTFNWYTNNACNSPAAATSSALPLSSGTVDATGFAQGPLGAGQYSFQAVYAGDNTYNGSTGACEPLTVNKATLSISTTVHNAAHAVIVNNANVPNGTVAHDNANVTGAVAGFAIPAISFTFDGSAIANAGSPEATFDATTIATSALSAGPHTFNATVASNSNYTGATSADEPFSVDKASPTISTVPSAGGVIGTTLNDSATLSGGSNPTGDVTFTLYSPSDATCASAPAYTETDHTAPYATAVGFTSNAVGTWHWKAHYAGDANNNAADSACADEAVTITKASPTLSTTIHDASHNPITTSIALGSTVHDSATISGGSNPTGNVTFTFYSNGSCNADVAPGTGAGSVALANGVADPSSSQGPLNAGSYSFSAHYAGDANNNSADASCEPLTVNKGQLSISTDIHDAAHAVVSGPVALGSIVHDTATVGGQVGSIAPTGAVTFSFDKSPAACGTASIATDAGLDGGKPRSVDTSKLGAGSYNFKASIAGDSNYVGASSDCEPLTVNKADLAITTTVHDASHAVIANGAHVALGTIAHDNATVTGGVTGFPIPAISFTLNGGAIANDSTEGSFSATSVASSPLSAGSDKFNATVASDANYNGATSADEPFTVDKAQLTIDTTVHDASHAVIANGGHVALGSTAHDNATIGGAVSGFALPGITFTFDGSSIANAGSAESGFDASTVATDALLAGPHHFNATVASNANYIGATSSDEPFTTDKGQLHISTAIHDPQHNVITSGALGSIVHDTASVTGQIGSIAPTGAVSFTFDKSPAACGTTAIANGTAESGTPRSVDTSALGAGSYNFRAVVADDANYTGATSDCEPLTVNKAPLSITTTVHDSNHTDITNKSIEVGDTAHDNAKVTGAVSGFAIPAITFNFDGSAIANGSTESGFDATSIATSALATGNHKFNATVAGDDNYTGNTSADEPFNVVDGAISITPPSAFNEINQAHTVTAHVTKNDGSGSVDASGVLVTFSIAPGSATFVAGNTCTTGANGQCSVQINSTGTGSNTIHATATFTVGGVSITRATGDGKSTDSADATKTYENAQISIAKDGTNEVGQDHTFTVTVKKDVGDGSGLVAASGATVTGGITGTGSLNGGTCVSGTTDANGQCTIIVHSLTAGTGTVHASVTLTLNGVAITRATGDGLSGDSADGHKTWVDAKIVLSPLTATNNIGSPHTITATVTQNDGSGSAPANGVLVTFSLLNNTAGADFIPTHTDNTCTTNASGQCSVQINSSTPGSVDIQGAVTFSVGGVSLTRTSGDGAHGDSANANKLYVAGNLDITKVVDMTGYPTQGFGNVNGTFTFHIVGPSYPGPAGHDETFTITNGVLQAPTTIHLTNLIPGSYTVTENNPGAGWTVTGGGSVAVVANQTATESITNKVKVGHTTISIVANTQETSPGENVVLTITDTNDGQVPLNNPSVVLNYGTTKTLTKTTNDSVCSYTSGDTNNDGIMDVGESWIWTCKVMLQSDTTIAVDGHGTDSFGTDVSPANGVTTEHGQITIKVVNGTRTLGFWQTHTNFTSTIFSSKLGSNMPIGTTPHKGAITTTGQLFGGFYAPIAKTTTGQKRSQIDQARIQLLQQLIAAKLNCASFGCGATAQGLISAADIAYAGSNVGAIQNSASALDAYNNSGDTFAFPASLPATGSATPQTSKSIANLTFWDLP